MVTRPSAKSLLGEERVERELEELRSQVQKEKEKVRSYFHQLHLLLEAREGSVLIELDEIVDRVRTELTEKRALLQQLNTAREGLERDLTKNKLRELLEKNVRSLEDGMGEGVTVGWVEVEWNVEGVEVSVSDVCKVKCLEEKPVNYSVKVRPVWSRVITGEGLDQISWPMQIAIDNTTQNIFVTDLDCPRIQVFDSEANHLYTITDGIVRGSIGISLTNEFIFVTSEDYLLKLNKSSNNLIESVKTETPVCGIEVNEQTNIYVCEIFKQTIVVFDLNLKFLRRIKLKSSHLQSNQTQSVKLYQNNLYTMFGECLTFHLQIFSLEGDLIRCLISKEEIKRSYFFTIDQVGNIIVADYGGNQIKIFSNEGDAIHTITNEDLTVNEKFYRPYGIALDNSNRIIVAQKNPECCLQAF